jgi:hypothetical protein
MNVYSIDQLNKLTLTELKNMLDYKQMQMIKLKKIRSTCTNLIELRLLNLQLNNLKIFIKNAGQVARTKLQFNNHK